MQRRCTLAIAVTVLLAGCALRSASPLDDGWYAASDGDDTDRRNRHELPAWVTDEWSADAAAGTHGTPGASAATHSRTTAGDRDAAPESLGDCIGWALDHHPAIQAAEARWHAARQRIITAQTLPDPELTYRIAVDQADTDQWPVGHTIGIAQMFPWFGTLDAAGKVQAAEARAVAQQYVAAQLSVVSEIKRRWAEYAYLHGAADVHRQQIRLLEPLEAAVRSRFRTSGAGQRDLVRVQSEIDLLTNDLRDVEDMLDPVRAQLNAAIGRRTEAAMPASPSLPQVAVDIDPDALVERLVAANPDLEHLRNSLTARRHARELADKQFYPEVMLGVEYGINTSKRMAHNERLAGRPGGGTDMFAARIGVRLPIWRDAYDAASREALAEWGAALRALRDRENTLEAELKMTLYNMRDAQRRLDLFGTRLRTRAEQVFESTAQAYRTGEATFTDLIESQRELLAYELAAIRAEADRFQQLAALEALVGQSFDRDATEARP